MRTSEEYRNANLAEAFHLSAVGQSIAAVLLQSKEFPLVVRMALPVLPSSSLSSVAYRWPLRVSRVDDDMNDIAGGFCGIS